MASLELSLVRGVRVRAAAAVTAGSGVVGSWRFAPGKVVLRFIVAAMIKGC